MEQRHGYAFFAVETCQKKEVIFMETLRKEHHVQNTVFHFKRPRLNRLFTEAMKYPLVTVCAGSGYGKTSAVHDFMQEYQAATVWVQLSERDNIGARFWENYIHSMMPVNAPFANAINKLGFPDTAEKANQYHTLLRDHAEKRRRILVFDDFHFIKNPAIIRIMEDGIGKMPEGTSLFLISRSTPLINTAGLFSKNHIFNISEDELRFTESELAQYFREQGISLKPDNLREIMQDTDGWAFALNLTARSYLKAPGYGGYLRNAMKSNIFKLMETEIWNGISQRLQIFLARLSLIDHLSVDLIALLAEGDEELTGELEQQNAYVRLDNYINAYLIHPLFLEFLAAKQELLSQEQKHQTYTIAGKWCDKNGFKIDALSYYEKIGDYESIVRMFLNLPAQIPYDIACYAAAVFERARPDAFDTIDFLAATHLRSVMCQGLWQDAVKLAEYYEAKYMKLPEDDAFRRRALSTIYYCMAIIRASMCLTQDRYDFDIYFEKLDKCFSKPINPVKLINPCPGPWICAVGSERKGAPQEFNDALKRSASHISRCFNGFETGEEELVCGELLFYQGDARAAEPHIARALEKAHKRNLFEIEHRALFYTLRLAVSQGNYQNAETALKNMKERLDDTGYINRFVNYDISLAWYLCAIGLPEKTPDWLKENFSPYGHAGFIENFANQMKARYCYATRNYAPLLSYIHEMKQRESYLFGRVEMLAIEACVHYKMKNREKTCAALAEAYKAASPNGVFMPFIELGKDMRTLTSFALKKTDCEIPKHWLESVNRKSASYAKRLAHVVTGYKQANSLEDGIAISPRENEILTDLSHGLSRTEIAASRSLSINTVKMVINNVYMKLGAENLAEAIRIAAKRKIV